MIWPERPRIGVCEQYDVDYYQQKNSSRGYRVLLGLAYLFVGLALITVLGANWDNIPRELRMSGLIALTMGRTLGARKLSAGTRRYYFFRVDAVTRVAKRYG